MTKEAKKMGVTFLLLTSLTLFASAPKGHKTDSHEPDQHAKHRATNDYQIKKFRFSRHDKQRFERLVLEFAARGDFEKGPSVRLVPNESDSEVTIRVSDAAITGSIPESAINESYANKSRLLGPISLNTDDPSEGFTVKTFFKDSGLTADAFWLESPYRLIIDVYPKGAVRSKGPHVLKSTQRNLASEYVEEDSPKLVKASKSDFYRGRDTVLCFPAGSQVSMSIGFASQPGGNAKSKVNVDNPGANLPTDPTAIVCYPVAAQLKATIHFHQKDGGGMHEGAPNYIYESPQSAAPGPRNTPSGGVFGGGNSRFGGDADLIFGSNAGVAPRGGLHQRGLSSTPNTGRPPALNAGSLLPPLK